MGNIQCTFHNNEFIIRQLRTTAMTKTLQQPRPWCRHLANLTKRMHHL